MQTKPVAQSVRGASPLPEEVGHVGQLAIHACPECGCVRHCSQRVGKCSGARDADHAGPPPFPSQNDDLRITGGASLARAAARSSMNMTASLLHLPQFPMPRLKTRNPRACVMALKKKASAVRYAWSAR